jgi:hypothetical protein
MALDYTTAAEVLTEATTLHEGLIVGLAALPDFPEPVVIDIPSVGAVPADLTETVTLPTLEELTNGAVAGSGAFDVIMSSVHAHIESQYFKGIIGKSDIAAVYVASIQAAMQQGLQFVLQSGQAYWAAKMVQIQAQNAYLERSRLVAEVETAKLMAYRAQADAYAAQVGAMTAQMTYANSKLALSKTLQEINNLEINQAIGEANYDDAYVKTHDTLPAGGAAAGHAGREFDLKDAAIDNASRQGLLITAQTNVQRAQTYGTNTDLTAVEGVIGIQKQLYEQQIESYQLDGKNKGVKLLADLWTSAKALDDAVESPGPLAGNLLLAMNTYINDLGLPNAMVNADTPAVGDPSTDTNLLVPGEQ